MLNAKKKPITLQSLPLWRLLVMADDAERWGDAPQVRVVSRIIKERLREQQGGARNAREGKAPAIDARRNRQTTESETVTP
jgi:hypothetical protein